MKRIEPQPIIDLSRPEQQPTQLIDLSRTLQLRTVRLEIPESLLAELREAPAPAPAAAAQVVTSPAAGAASLQTGKTLIFQPLSVQTQRLALPHHLLEKPPSPELSHTLYDGGALRELALQLVHAREGVDQPACPQDVLLPAPELPPGTLRRKLAAFRRWSLPKRLTIVLLPLAIAGVWAMPDGAASPAGSRTSVRAAPRPAPPAAGQVPSASPTSLAPSAPLAPSARDTAALETATQPGDRAERLALIAAFSGNKAEAAALYDRLAASRNSHVFALAAQLTREDRVRKP